MRKEIILVSLLLFTSIPFSSAQQEQEFEPPSRLDAAVSRSSAETSAKLTQVLKRDLYKEVILLREINTELESYLPALRKENELMEVKVKEAEAEAKKLRREIEGLKKQDIKGELNTLKSEHRQAIGELNHLKRTNTDLEKKFIGLKGLKERFDEKSRELEKALGEKRDLLKELNKIKKIPPAPSKKEDAEKTALVKERESLKKKIADLEREKSALKELNLKLESKLSGELGILKKQIEVLRKRLEASAQEEKVSKKDDSALAKDLKFALDAKTKEMSDLLAERKTTLKELSSLKKDNEALKSRAGDEEALKAKLNAALKDRSSALSESSRAKRDKEVLLKELARIKQANIALEERISGKKQE